MVAEWPIVGIQAPLYFLVVMPRGGPEPAVAHKKPQEASLGLNLPVVQGGSGIRIPDRYPVS